MRRVRRRGGLIATAVLGVGGALAAIAFAVPEPGRPETTRVQTSWTAALVRSSEKTCTSDTGDPVRESIELFQASAANTTASDPRLDGRLDIYVHSVVQHGADRRGLVDGSAHWFSGDIGPQTAFAKLQGMISGSHIEAFMGGRNTDDGFVVRQGALPRAKLFAPFQTIFNVDANGEILDFNGSFGAPLLVTASDGIEQAFLCGGEYVPVSGGAPTATRAAGPTDAQLQRGVDSAVLPHEMPARPPVPLLPSLDKTSGKAGGTLELRTGL